MEKYFSIYKEKLNSFRNIKNKQKKIQKQCFCDSVVETALIWQDASPQNKQKTNYALLTT